MSIEREARINKIWLVSGSDIINMVEFSWAFTASDRPGVQSFHLGLYNIAAAGLHRGDADELIIGAIDTAIPEDQLVQILSFQDHQLTVLYDQSTSTEINLLGPTTDDVDAERDRRIDAGFTFGGVVYQCRYQDRENIAGAKSAATDAKTIYGAQAGDFAWRRLLDPNGPEIFRWIAADNTEVPMDADTTIRLGYAALAWKESHIYAARLIKNMPTIPADFATNPNYWPGG